MVQVTDAYGKTFNIDSGDLADFKRQKEYEQSLIRGDTLNVYNIDTTGDDAGGTVADINRQIAAAQAKAGVTPVATPPSITQATTQSTPTEQEKEQQIFDVSGFSFEKNQPQTANVESVPTFYQPKELTYEDNSIQTVMFRNERGQQVPVTLKNNQPITYVPPGFTRMAEGGFVSLDAENDLASKFLGYRGEKSRPALDNFYKSNPGAAARMGKYQQAMVGMAQGGVVKMQQGGMVNEAELARLAGAGYDTSKLTATGYDLNGAIDPGYASSTPYGVLSAGILGGPESAQMVPGMSTRPRPVQPADPLAPTAVGYEVPPPPPPTEQQQPISYTGDVVPMFGDVLKQTFQPIQAPVSYITPTAQQDIATGTGQVSTVAPIAPAATVDTVQQAAAPVTTPASTYDAANVQRRVQESLEGVERDYIEVSPSDAGFIPPPANAMVTQAFEFFHNPTTGEIVTVPTGGFTPPEGFVKGRPEGKFKTEGVKEAQGEIRPGAVIEAQRGKLSPGSMVDAAEFDQDFINKINTGKLNVTEQQLVEAKGQDEIAAAVKIAQTSGIDPAIAQQATVSVNELPQPAQIAESNMAQAQVAKSGGFLREEATMYAAKLNSFSVDNGTLAKAIQGEVGALGTVQGQLEGLLKQFDDGTPAWAGGAIRAANAVMASRGLSGSSIAGAAILQAAMESALPIAQQDAQTFNEMNMSNINRRQQVSLTNAAAQQGLSLQNLSNEQQAALQNSTNAFALQTQDLSNMQQTFLSNAQIKASLQGQNLSNQQQTNLVTAARYAEVANMNLNNRQQTALVNNANNLQVDLTNLSNRQQAYVSNAQLGAALQGKQIDNQQQAAIQNAARFSEAANISFTADQQEQLHNSELMKTIGLANLSNSQAEVLQNAATSANLDMTNLNNRQQSEVQNAQNFLQMDLTNLSNEQQVALFKAQQNIQSLFTDQAATNASAQFNASSENQTNQYFASLASQTSQFNATQTNALNQFNVNAVNSINEFNSNLQNQRDQFNANSGLVVAQANAQWRQNLATVNTASQNESNREFAQTINAMTSKNVDQVWQRERDIMSLAYQTAESNADNATQIILQQMAADATITAAELQAKIEATQKTGNFLSEVFLAAVTGKLGGIL